MVTRDHFVLRGKTKYPQDRMSCGPQNRSGHISGGKETSQRHYWLNVGVKLLRKSPV
jgi:hypothetical protein